MTKARSIVQPLIRDISQPITGTKQVTKVFILAGQSNMIGRDSFDGLQGHPTSVLQYSQGGSLIAAAAPLDHIDAISGDMGLDVQFAIDYLANFPSHSLVLLPAAKGGTGFADQEWRVGDSLYSDLVTRTNTLFSENPSFELGGILWHQGEADSGYAGYQVDLDNLIDGLRADISAAGPTTPFILGGLLPDHVESGSDALAINDVIMDTPNRKLYTAVASSYQPSRLASLGDGLHFDAESLRLLGSRFFSSLEIARTNKPAAPDQITDLAAAGENQQVILSWSQPNSGGNPVSDYIVERSLDGASWTTISDGVSATTGYVDSGLSNGTNYFYRVAAVNSVGQGEMSLHVNATPTLASASIASTAFAATTADGKTHSFAGVDVGLGGTVIVGAASRNSTSKFGLTGITVNGQAATLFDRNEVGGNYLRFGYVTSVPAGSVDIELTHEHTQFRAGIHVWVVENTDPGSATEVNISGTSGAVDAFADGLLLGIATSINPGSQNIDWSGLDERIEWSNYGDTFGSGSADRAFVSDAPEHAVSITTDGNYKAISLLSIPKA